MTITTATLLARLIEAVENPHRLPGAARTDGHPEAHQRWDIGGYKMLVDVEPEGHTRSMSWLPAKQMLAKAHLGLNITYDPHGMRTQAILSSVGPCEMSAHHFGYRLTRSPNGTKSTQWVYAYSNVPRIYVETPEKLRRLIVMDVAPHVVQRIYRRLPDALRSFVDTPDRTAATAQAA